MNIFLWRGIKILFFERLSVYIKKFDLNWENSIKGASIEKIDRYLDLTTQNRKQLVIPKEYIIYLKKMGEYDGGLLEDFIKGSTNIEVLIDYFENMNKFPDWYEPIPLNHILIGHSEVVETDIFLNYYNNFNNVCKKYKMLKAWISDQYNYIAYNDVGIVYMKLDFNLHGHIWSDDEQFAIELSNALSSTFNEY